MLFYADDIDIKYAQASEAKINENKTEILWIGEGRIKRRKGDLRFEEKIQDKIKIWGTIFTNDRDQTSDLNLTKIEEIIDKHNTEQFKYNKGIP